MKRCEALIIGGSAGSLEVLLKVLPGLNPSLDFPIIIVLHRKPGKDNILTDLLAHKTKLKVKEVTEKEKADPNTIYIAPPDYHLLIENDRTFSLDASEKINFSRPSIDVTFESAAAVYRENVVSLLLSGANTDGTNGFRQVVKYGGRTFVQNPETATVNIMPENALLEVGANGIWDPQQIAEQINRL